MKNCVICFFFLKTQKKHHHITCHNKENHKQKHKKRVYNKTLSCHGLIGAGMITEHDFRSINWTNTIYSNNSKLKTIDIACQQILELTDDMLPPYKIETLIIKFSPLTSVFLFSDKLPTILDLSNNQISKLHIYGSGINKLDLRSNSFTSLSDKQVHFPANLSFLDLSENFITNIDNETTTTIFNTKTLELLLNPVTMVFSEPPDFDYWSPFGFPEDIHKFKQFVAAIPTKRERIHFILICFLQTVFQLTCQHFKFIFSKKK